MNRLQRTSSAPARPSRTLAVAPFEGFDRSNCLAVQQEIIDDQLADFTEGELKVMLMVTRATAGGQREGVPLSVRILCDGGAPETLPGKGTGLSPRTVQAACAALETAGFLRISRRIAPDGSGLPSLFTLPLNVPGMNEPGMANAARFPGYAAGRRVRLPLMLIDRLLGELSGAELKVLLYILRHTFCVGSADEVMPMARLVENTGLSLRHTRLAVGGLTSRSVIALQHRQDPERGKLASRFGVKVIGEAAPFSLVAAAPQPARAEEPPVWLVPVTGPPTPDTPALEEPGDRQGQTEAWPLHRVPAAEAGAPPAAEQANVPPAHRPRYALPEGSATPIVVAGQSPRTTPPSRSVPAAFTYDASPAWAAVKLLLSQRLPYPVFVDRIAPTVSVGDSGPELLITVQDEYHRWWLESKLGLQVRQALQDAGYAGMTLRYLNFVGDRPAPAPSQE
jgi:hypothetical protein